MTDDQTHVPITFIVGVGRSGTSILGEWLQAHESVQYLFESSMWSLLLARWRADERQRDSTLRSAREWAEQRIGSARVLVEKNPRHCWRIQQMRAMFPQSKWIMIVRDPRDVACSLRAIWESDSKAASEWGSGDPTYEWSDIRRMASVWVMAQAALLSGIGVASIAPFIVNLRYEDLLEPSSRGNAREQILRLLDLPLSENMDAFGECMTASRGGYEARGQDRYRRGAVGSRVGAWRWLPAREQRQLCEYLAPWLARYGYEGAPTAEADELVSAGGGI